MFFLYLDAPRPPFHRDASCKTEVNRVSRMPFCRSLNPYRGCTHACHSSHARATHPHLGLNAGDDFSGVILVKTNLPEVLRAELARPAWRRELVALGTATDPYQPCEGRYRITRRALEALRDVSTPVSVVTKSTLVLRDLDLLRDLAALPGTRVNVTVTTLDRTLWRAVEPGTPPPERRLEILSRLADAGIPCGVFMAPVIPGLTDSAASIDAVAAAAREAGATSFWAAPLRLAGPVRGHWLGELARLDPELAARHARAYPAASPPRAYAEALSARIAAIRARHGFVTEKEEPAPAPMAAGPAQLALF